MLILKECTLLVCFNTLCHHAHVKTLTHVDHRAYDAGIVRVGREVPDERIIDF